MIWQADELLQHLLLKVAYKYVIVGIIDFWSATWIVKPRSIVAFPNRSRNASSPFLAM